MNELQYWKHESQSYYVYNEAWYGSRSWHIGVDNNIAGDDFLFYRESEAGSPAGLENWSTWGSSSSGAPYIVEEGVTSPEIEVTGNGVTISDGNTSPRMVLHTNFGSVEGASGSRLRTFTIENNGNADLVISSVTISGNDASDFDVTDFPDTTISAGGNSTFNVNFAPADTGEKTATLLIVNNDDDEGTYDFSIKGDSYTPKTISVSGITTPSAANGTYIHQGILNEFQYWKHETQGYYIYNEAWYSARYWYINDADTCGNDTDYFFYKGSEDAVPAGLTSWQVSSNASGSPEMAYAGPEINVLGNGVDIVSGDATPQTSDYTDFGSVDVSSGTVSRTFTIRNTGAQDLSLNGNPLVAVSGTNGSDFSVTLQPDSVVAANTGETTFTVQFDPSGAGVRVAGISIDNDDSNETPYIFAIQGTGVNASPVINSLDGDSLSYSEGDGVAIIDQGTAVSVTDADSSDMDGGVLTVSISAGKDAAEDKLCFYTGAGVTLSGITSGCDVSVDNTVVGTLDGTIALGADLIVTLGSNSTAANVAALIAAVAYENTDIDNPTTGVRTLDFTLSDGDGGTSTTASVAVTLRSAVSMMRLSLRVRPS